MKGYKWIRGFNETDYIITLNCENAFPDPALTHAFYTTDCTVISIKDKYGREIDYIKGIAFYEFAYKKGQRITGHQIYFYKSESHLRKMIEISFSKLRMPFVSKGVISTITSSSGTKMSLNRIEYIADWKGQKNDETNISDEL